MMGFIFEGLPGRRRLPIYLLLDVSASMEGEPLRKVEQAVALLQHVAKAIPQAAQTVWMSAITFSSQASVIIPLTEIAKFKLPGLYTGGEADLGAALEVLTVSFCGCKGGADEKLDNDYKPYIFLFTDGQSIERSPAAIREFRREWPPESATIVGLGCGPQVNLPMIQRISDISLTLVDISDDSLAAFFRWITQSVRIASLSAALGKQMGSHTPGEAGESIAP